MTATPIPRTMAMTVYGDLDVSTIAHLPPGRLPVITKVLREKERQSMYREIAEALARGEQAYMIYPLVEESESELLAGIKDATTMAAELQNGPFKYFKVGLMHGRLTAEEKNAVMEAFHRHEIDLLISTTVVEVGIDVPSATILVVEHAERFGLSQLHQLRGRVGRGQSGGTCLLMIGGHAGDEAFERLMVLKEESSGFKVAEADLAIRGPGDIIGTRQSGMPSLKYGDLLRDGNILKAARQDAKNLLLKDPELKDYPGLRELVKNLWQDHLYLATVS
jgi:ATP-dependent DNA helicase RecG